MEPLTVLKRIRDFERDHKLFVAIFSVNALTWLFVFFITTSNGAKFEWELFLHLILYPIPVFLIFLLWKRFSSTQFYIALSRRLDELLGFLGGLLDELLGFLGGLLGFLGGLLGCLIVVGLILWAGAALFSSAPWWAALIIILLIIIVLFK